MGINDNIAEQMHVATNSVDLLDSLAHLSSDEVATPIATVNRILDLLPEKVWENPEYKFLDPCMKRGEFGREIVKRLFTSPKMVKSFPNDKERLEHILYNQVYGLPITGFTAMLSRRTVYCSKDASSDMSYIKFDNKQGNIVFPDNIEHKFVKETCEVCGASESTLGKKERRERETYAYPFIHSNWNGFGIVSEMYKNVGFDVIVGNPPYQMKDGEGGKGSSAMPLYHKFVEKAINSGAQYVSMIIPSRWFAGGKGLDNFRNAMLNDHRMRKIVDYPDASECFPGVEIKGGVCYFLWDKDYNGECEIITVQDGNMGKSVKRNLDEWDVFIRWNEAINILRKTQTKETNTFNRKILSRNPFGFTSNFKDFSEKSFTNAIKIYSVGKGKSGAHEGWVEKDKIKKNESYIDSWKVYTSKAAEGAGTFPNRIMSVFFIGEPNSICTETYLMVGPLSTKQEAENTVTYMKTKFFRFMVMLRKPTQNMAQGVFKFVPDLPMDQVWTDEKLYEYFGLTEDEQAYIESMIKPLS